MINVVVEADSRPQIRRPTPDKEANIRPLLSMTCKFSNSSVCLTPKLASHPNDKDGNPCARQCAH